MYRALYIYIYIKADESDSRQAAAAAAAEGEGEQTVLQCFHCSYSALYKFSSIFVEHNLKIIVQSFSNTRNISAVRNPHDIQATSIYLQYIETDKKESSKLVESRHNVKRVLVPSSAVKGRQYRSPSPPFLSPAPFGRLSRSLFPSPRRYIHTQRESVPGWLPSPCDDPRALRLYKTAAGSRTQLPFALSLSRIQQQQQPASGSLTAFILAAPSTSRQCVRARFPESTAR